MPRRSLFKRHRSSYQGLPSESERRVWIERELLRLSEAAYTQRDSTVGDHLLRSNGGCGIWESRSNKPERSLCNQARCLPRGRADPRMGCSLSSLPGDATPSRGSIFRGSYGPGIVVWHGSVSNNLGFCPATFFGCAGIAHDMRNRSPVSSDGNPLTCGVGMLPNCTLAGRGGSATARISHCSTGRLFLSYSCAENDLNRPYQSTAASVTFLLRPS